ncbi:MAG TPA: nucleotide exchange factor GrpE [Kofleriaceae bacterium]|nr:nucleotide exchange factor GrpE [Kofleriaceae bacterium]
MSPTTEDPEKPQEVTAPASAEAADASSGNGDGGLVIEVDASETPAAKLAAAEAKIATLSQEKKDLYDKFVRAMADLENFRKRSRRDLDDARHDSKTRVLKEMLPVVDNLERAIQHSSGGDAAAILEGVKLVLRQFTHAFERSEVTAVEAEGKPFDPNLHEAIGQQESELPPGTVVNVLQRGYKLGDKLLRPALVVVAKAKAAPAAETAETTDTSDTAEIPPAAGGDGGGGGEPAEGGNG